MNISHKQKLLHLIAKIIEESKELRPEKVVELLRRYNNFSGADDIGIIDANGIAYTVQGEKLDVSEYQYFTQAMKGLGGLSKDYISKDKKEMFIISTVPIYIQDKVEMVLMATYEQSHFTRLIDQPFFDGEGKCLVMDFEGNLLTQENELHEMNKEFIWEHIQQHYSRARGNRVYVSCDKNYLEYEVNGEKYLAYHEPLGIYDWVLISYMPKEVVYTNLDIINTMMSKMLVFIGIGTGVLIIVFLKQYKSYQKNILHSVCTDELTNLNNYEYLRKYFKKIKAKDKEDKFLVVMDIDKFKSINIMYKTCVGDELLKYIASIYQELLPYDKLFRCEADTFVGIIEGRLEEDIVRKLSKLQNRIQEDIEQKRIVPISLSFGGCSLEAFEDLRSIYTNALICKNKAKHNISKKIYFFNHNEQRYFIENRKIEEKFIDAVKNSEFEVWYQPKYNMKTKELYGAEALVRWCEKDGQYILPSYFIPVFEKSGQIVQLDKVVIGLTFKHIQEMKQLGIKIKPISINLSRKHEQHSELIDYIKVLMKNYKINPKDVSFEITESALIENSEFINKIINGLHGLGFQVDIDDFGVGTSTLNSLYAAEFDTLKLDRSFIDNIGKPKMNSIIQATIQMAQALNMKIIAEGVETEEQLQFLVEKGCLLAQGYYFSPPVHFGDYLAMNRLGTTLEEDKYKVED